MTTDNVQQVEADATQAQETAIEAVAEGEVQADASTDEPSVEIERLKTENAQWEQRYKSLQGAQQVRMSGPDVMAAISEVRAEVRTQRWEQERQRWELADVDEDTRREKLNQISAQERAASSEASLRQTSDRMAEDVSNALLSAGIDASHPKAQEAIQAWGAATSIEDYVAVTLEVNKFIVAEKDRVNNEALTEEKKKADELRRQYNVESGALTTGAGGGTPSGVNANWEKVRDAYIENPYDQKIRKQYHEMRQARGV
jgi:hypothetical protein